MNLIERREAAQKSVAVDLKNAETLYRQAWKVLNSDKPQDEFFMQSMAMGVMLVYPLYAVPAMVVNTVRVYLSSTHKLA